MTAMAVGTERDLRPLFEPRFVAVVGASNDPAKWGQWLARGAVRGENRRSVFLVSRSGADVSDEQIEESIAFDTQVASEDVALFSSVQLGLDSRAVPQGRLMGDSEQLVAAFQRRVHDALTA